MNRAPDRFLVALAVLAVAAFAAACTDSPTSAGASNGPGGSGSNSTIFEPPTSFGPPPGPTPPDETTPVAVDQALLELLPTSIDGVALEEDEDEAAIAQNDPALSQIATSLDAAVAVDAGSGNLVYVLVVQLRPDAFGGVLYDQWRDSFDDGACAAAGGVTTHAEATLGGRRTFITSCAESLRTYHVLLDVQDVVISASSIGEGRFGEKLMETLRVPT